MNAEPASQTGGGRDRVLEDLRALLGERLSTSAAVREQHGQATALSQFLANLRADKLRTAQFYARFTGGQ